MTNHAFAARLRGFGPVGLLAIFVVLAGNLIAVPVSALLVLVWVVLSRTPWREIGYTRPKSWLAEIAIGLAFGSAFKLVMKAFVMPLLGAPATNQAYHFLVGNTAVLPAMLFAVIVGAGFGEETVFRAYSFERLGKLCGSGTAAKVFIVAATSLWFGAVHYPDQGLPGVEQAAIVGLVYGTIFAMTGRIWMLMIAHAAFDIVAVAIIYFDIESRVAHFV